MSKYKDFLVLDTETTGLDTPMKAVEVAWLVIDSNMKIKDEFVQRINPERPINPGASEIHGIYDHDVIDCPTIDTVISRLPKPFVAIGHNVGYDLRVLAEHVAYNATVCTLALARRWVKGAPNHKLSTMKEYLGLSDQASHSALGDCHTALELLQHCAELSGRDLLGLIELESTPKLLPKMPFGMHKGKAFHEVPKAYRDWLMSKPDLHQDLEYTLRKLSI